MLSRAELNVLTIAISHIQQIVPSRVSLAKNTRALLPLISSALIPATQSSAKGLTLSEQIRSIFRHDTHHTANSATAPKDRARAFNHLNLLNQLRI